MANESPLLKISSSLEIPQNNKKNFPTEDESNTMTDCPDEKPSEFEFPKDTVADATKGQSNFFSISFYSLFVFSVQVKIRAGVFYQDLKTRAEGEIFKYNKTRTASISTGLKSSSFCELIDKFIFKINLF